MTRTHYAPKEMTKHYAIRSILAATDLEDGSDAIVRSAATLATQSGADFHLLHALDLPSTFEEAQDTHTRHAWMRLATDREQKAEERLRLQLSRALPEGSAPASQRTSVLLAHEAILHEADEVEADLIVLGPHQGGAVRAHFLGTTADHVIRTAEVPCLVVSEPLREQVRQIGVPVDVANPSQGAVETALAWALQLGGVSGAEPAAYPVVRVMYVGWTVERIDNPDMEETLIRPALKRLVEQAVAATPEAENLDVRVEILWANEPIDKTVRWVEGEEIDLLVVGTYEKAWLHRALIGSMASSLARQTPCPVLLVPPSDWGGRPRLPQLNRVVVATDFSGLSEHAARWSVRHLAPEAQHTLVHVLDVPEPPWALSRSSSSDSRSELLQTAREGAQQRVEALRDAVQEAGGGNAPTVRTEVRSGQPAEQVVDFATEDLADLVVVGEHGQDRGAWVRLGSTAERVLRSSPAPVLVARGELEAPPRSLLVAVDGSDQSLQALAWADFLRARFDAPLTAVYVEPLSLHDVPTIVPAGGPATHAVASSDGEKPDERERAAAEWLRDELRRADIDPSTVSVRTAVGSPAAEVLDAQEDTGADLVIMGSRGRGAIGRAVLGSVAGAVLRSVPCPVLLVGAQSV